MLASPEMYQALLGFVEPDDLENWRMFPPDTKYGRCLHALAKARGDK